jgi:hypothetical protein
MAVLLLPTVGDVFRLFKGLFHHIAPFFHCSHSLGIQLPSSEVIRRKSESLEPRARSRDLLHESKCLLQEYRQTVERSHQLLEKSREVLDRAKRIIRLDLKVWIIQLVPLFGELVPYGSY